MIRASEGKKRARGSSRKWRVFDSPEVASVFESYPGEIRMKLLGCVPRFVEKERRPPLRHQSIRSGGNLRVFENLAQTLVAVDAS